MFFLMAAYQQIEYCSSICFPTMELFDRVAINERLGNNHIVGLILHTWEDGRVSISIDSTGHYFSIERNTIYTDAIMITFISTHNTLRIQTSVMWMYNNLSMAYIISHTKHNKDLYTSMENSNIIDWLNRDIRTTIAKLGVDIDTMKLSSYDIYTPDEIANLTARSISVSGIITSCTDNYIADIRKLHPIMKTIDGVPFSYADLFRTWNEVLPADLYAVHGLKLFNELPTESPISSTSIYDILRLIFPPIVPCDVQFVEFELMTA